MGSYQLYVVSSLNKHAASEPNFSVFSYFNSFYPLLDQALLHDPSLINQRLLHDKPCLHLIENDVHLKHLHSDRFDESAYQLAMKDFKKKHNIKSERLNAKKPHLFLDIIQSNHNVTARIRALHGMGGFSLMSLDKDNSSLLDHACQRADRDLLDWCFEHMPASELRITSKRRSYLDHALRTQDHAFCEHLFRNKLSTEQMIEYFKTIKPDDASMKQLIAFQFFGLNNDCDRQNQFRQMASWPNTLFKQHLVVKIQAPIKASPVESSVMIKAPITSALTLSALEKAITANQVHKIKLFKTLPFNNALDGILANHIERILTLCMRENNYNKMQSKQQHRHADDQEMHVNMMNELMDIAAVHDWIVTHVHQAITMAIGSQSIGALSLCLRALDENTSREILAAHGFDYALLALDSDNPSMLRMILDHKTMLEQVILHQNELLMASLIKHKTNDALLLLRMPQLNCFAHINDNQALCHASGFIELSSVALTLLELPEVAQNAAVANNSVFYHAKHNKDDDLMHALIHLPCVKETLPEAERDAIAQTTDVDKASMAYEHRQENVVSIDDAPIQQQPIQTINPELAILFNDVASLDYFLSTGVSVETMKHLIMYSLHCRKPGLVQHLFHGSVDKHLIESDAYFCHHMMHTALLYLCYPVMEIGFDIDTRHPFLHLRKNQLLALCLDMNLLRSAHRLLECPSVIEDAHGLNNKILRHACRYNQVSVVDALLRIDAVRHNLHVFNHAPFREATLRGHREVFERLLKEPEVLDYVNQNKEQYPHPQAEHLAHYGRAQMLFGAMGHNPQHQPMQSFPSCSWGAR